MTKEARIYNGEKTVSSTNGAGKNWKATYKTMRLKHFLTSYAKINSKWFKDLNVRPETIKLLEENIGRTLFDVISSNIFLDQSSKTKEIKAK